MRSWLLLDLVSVLPLGLLMGKMSNSNNLSKVAKMYRLVKITNMSRVFHILTTKNLVFQTLANLVKFQVGTRRLLFLFLVMILLQHVISCLW